MTSERWSLFSVKVWALSYLCFNRLCHICVSTDCVPLKVWAVWRQSLIGQTIFGLKIWESGMAAPEPFNSRAKEHRITRISGDATSTPRLPVHSGSQQTSPCSLMCYWTHPCTSHHEVLEGCLQGHAGIPTGAAVFPGIRTSVSSPCGTSATAVLHGTIVEADSSDP